VPRLDGTYQEGRIGWPGDLEEEALPRGGGGSLSPWEKTLASSILLRKNGSQGESLMCRHLQITPEKRRPY